MNTLSRCIAAVALCLAGASASASAQPLPPPTVAVSGHGEVSTVPDRARLSLAADALNADLKRAEAEVNAIVRRYLDAVQPLLVKPEHIATTGVSLQPEYSWDEKARRQVLVGYRARREIRVLVGDLDRLGDFILRATAAGVNHVSPPQLESSRADALRLDALTRAAQDAQNKARTLAQALGVKLGAARTVRESGSVSPPPMPMKVMAMRAEAAYDSGNEQMGLATGEIRIAADVGVEFDLIGR